MSTEIDIQTIENAYETMENETIENETINTTIEIIDVDPEHNNHTTQSTAIVISTTNLSDEQQQQTSEIIVDQNVNVNDRNEIFKKEDDMKYSKYQTTIKVDSDNNKIPKSNHIKQQTTVELDTDDTEKVIKLSHLNVSYDKPRHVYCAAELTLLCVNLQTQLFDAEIELKFYWQQPEIGKFLSKPKNKDCTWSLKDDECSIPVDIDDPFDGDLALEWIEKEFSYDFKTSTVCMLLHLKDQFAERMELNRFPVDRQFLNILLCGRKNEIDEGNWIWITKAPKWVPEEYHDNKSQVQSRLGPSVSDYKMYTPWADFRMLDGLDSQPPFKLRFRVQRYPGFYIGNIVIPLILIIVCCFSSLAVPIEDTADRLSVTITLMLATVAFRFILTALLPPVPYLTWMDHYISFSFIVVALFIGENACATFVPMNVFPFTFVDSNIVTRIVLRNIDMLFAAIIVLLLLIANIFFIVAMCTNCCRYSWEAMDKQDRESEEDDFMCANPQHVAGDYYDERNTVVDLIMDGY
eukprot:289991_1